MSPALRAALPVDATGLTQAIDHLGAALGVDDLHGEQRDEHRANPAVLHYRVFGREPLSRDTVLGAFADGARVRADALLRLARAAGAEGEIAPLLAAHPAADAGASEDALRACYAAQEDAAVRIAATLDG